MLCWRRWHACEHCNKQLGSNCMLLLYARRVLSKAYICIHAQGPMWVPQHAHPWFLCPIAWCHVGAVSHHPAGCMSVVPCCMVCRAWHMHRMPGLATPYCISSSIVHLLVLTATCSTPAIAGLQLRSWLFARRGMHGSARCAISAAAAALQSLSIRQLQ